MRLSAAAVLITLLFQIGASPTAWAEPSPAAPKKRAKVAPEDVGIPSRPTAPPTLGAKMPENLFSCQRSFVYRGKTLPCDSNLSYDGENLRPILSAVPESIPPLDQYQRNRQKVRTLAYTGSLGLAMALVGHFVSKGYEGDKRILIRNLSVLSGFALTAGSFIYGFTLLNTNEANLREAVRVHNNARPQDPIELQLTTGLTF